MKSVRNIQRLEGSKHTEKKTKNSQRTESKTQLTRPRRAQGLKYTGETREGNHSGGKTWEEV